MNKIFIIGNLVRDPELSSTANGIAKCNFTVAVQRKFANASGEKEADFIPVVTWRATAENCGKYLKKGSKVGICGSLQIRSYEVEGQKRYVSEIIADDVEFLSSRSNSDDGQGKIQGEKAKTESDDDEELPF